MTAGLTFPFVTDLDPDRAGEGSLDPLGLARLADRLADQIAPEVTARMSRIRFVTAIAACSQLLGEPADMLSTDGIPAYLAFEWHVVESFVRVSPASGTDAVPGIQKARARLRDHRRHLNGPSYLETPKVFGFHGVYKRIARDMEVVDENLVLLPRGDELVATWERELQLDGFARRLSRTRGGRLALQLKGQVERALDKGAVGLGYSSQWWPVISGAFGPGDAGARERRQLWGWLVDPRWEVRREIALLIARDPGSATDERGAVERLLAESLSAELRNRLRAIDGFEAAVRPLDDGFRLLRSIATQRIPRPLQGLTPPRTQRSKRSPSRCPAPSGRRGNDSKKSALPASLRQNSGSSQNTCRLTNSWRRSSIAMTKFRGARESVRGSSATREGSRYAVSAAWMIRSYPAPRICTRIGSSRCAHLPGTFDQRSRGERELQTPVGFVAASRRSRTSPGLHRHDVHI